MLVLSSLMVYMWIVKYVFQYAHYYATTNVLSYACLMNVFLKRSNPLLQGVFVVGYVAIVGTWMKDPNDQHWQVPTKTQAEIVAERQQELDGTSPEVVVFVACAKASLTS